MVSILFYAICKAHYYNMHSPLQQRLLTHTYYYQHLYQQHQVQDILTYTYSLVSITLRACDGEKINREWTRLMKTRGTQFIWELVQGCISVLIIIKFHHHINNFLSKGYINSE